VESSAPPPPSPPNNLERQDWSPDSRDWWPWKGEETWSDWRWHWSPAKTDQSWSDWRSKRRDSRGWEDPQTEDGWHQSWRSRASSDEGWRTSSKDWWPETGSDQGGGSEGRVLCKTEGAEPRGLRASG
jgi:hypothetical protein